MDSLGRRTLVEGSERIFCGTVPSIGCRTIRNFVNGRRSFCASSERRIWRGTWKAKGNSNLCRLRAVQYLAGEVLSVAIVADRCLVFRAFCVRSSFCREFLRSDAPGTRMNRAGDCSSIYKMNPFVESCNGQAVFVLGNMPAVFLRHG